MRFPIREEIEFRLFMAKLNLETAARKLADWALRRPKTWHCDDCGKEISGVESGDCGGVCYDCYWATCVEAREFYERQVLGH